jgi:hypothetical protein
VARERVLVERGGRRGCECGAENSCQRFAISKLQQPVGNSPPTLHACVFTIESLHLAKQQEDNMASSKSQNSLIQTSSRITCMFDAFV